MTVFFEWLDLHPAAFGTIAWGAFAVCGISAWLAQPTLDRPRWQQRLAHPALFALLVPLVLCAFRWPSWFVPGEFNPDESQIVAGALTLRDYPVFWKYVDGTTHGPLNEIILTAASYLGLPLDYFGARALAALMLAASLLFLWATLRRFIPERAARLAILPALAFWSFSWTGDFLHFSSELMAILLLSAASWGVACALSSTSRRLFVLGSTGFLLALVPLAKLQVTPLAMAIGLGCVGVLAWRRLPAWQADLSVLCGGALLVVILLWVYLAVYGLEAQFKYSYLVSNLSYTGARKYPLVEMPNHFFEFMTTGQSFAWFFYGSVAFVLVQARTAWGEGSHGQRGLLVAGWIFLVFAFFCILAPGRQVAHYLHFLVLPISFLLALHLAATMRKATGAVAQGVLFIALGIAPQVQNCWLVAPSPLGRLADFKANPVSAAGKYIRERATRGQLLTVWGWNAQLHIETQLAQGTRDAHSGYQLIHDPLRDFYRSRYVRDMIRNQPEWFVDAVGPGRFGFEVRTVDGHETFPELAEVIRAHYVFQIELDSMRIYRRRAP